MVFLNGILFATIVPLIPFFVSIYFWVKYLVDKNNLLFLYVKKYESGGIFRTAASRFMIFNLIFYVAAISSLFSTMTDHIYVGAIGFFFGALALGILYFFIVDGFEIKENELVGVELLKTMKTIN